MPSGAQKGPEPARGSDGSDSHPRPGFLQTIATLRSKQGIPVEPLLWRLTATPSPNPTRTKSDRHQAIDDSLVYEDADFQRKTRWPHVLRPSDFVSESRADGTVVWQHAYRTGAANEVGDEQVALHADGTVSFQRATFWDVELPAIDFGLLAFDTVVFAKMACRYASKIRGVNDLLVELRVAAPRGAAQLLAMFHTGPVLAEQPSRAARLRRPEVVGRAEIAIGEVDDSSALARVCKRVLDGVANEFDLEASVFGETGPPFLAISLDRLVHIVGTLH